MKTNVLKVTFIVLVCLLTACFTNNEEEQYNPQLPPITQIGANNFGCKINGKIMVPRDSQVQHPGGGGYARGVTYSKLRVPKNTANFDFVKAVDRVTSRGGIAFKIPNIQNLGVGEYELNNIEPGFDVTHPNVIYMQAKYNNDLFGSIKGTGKITITRYDNEVISGTFSGKLKGYNNPENIIEITEGRFDFNKKTINTTKFN